MPGYMFFLLLLLIIITVVPGFLVVMRRRENPQKYSATYQELVTTENFQPLNDDSEHAEIKDLVAATSDGLKATEVIVNHAVMKKGAPAKLLLADVKYYLPMRGGGRHYLKSIACIPAPLKTCDIIIYPQPKSFLLRKMVSALTVTDAVPGFDDHFIVTFIPMRAGKISLQPAVQRVMLEYVSEYPFNQPQSSGGGSPASLSIGQNGICVEGNRTSQLQNLLRLTTCIAHLKQTIDEQPQIALEL